MNYLFGISKAAAEVFISEMNGIVDASVTGKCAGFISDIAGRMQPVNKAAFLLSCLFFDASAFIHTGRSFARLSLEARSVLITRWSGSVFSLKRDFVGLLLNLTLLAYYDSEEVLRQSGINVEAYRAIAGFFSSCEYCE